MAQAIIKGSGILSFTETDFEQGTQVDYIAKNKTATDIEQEPIEGTLKFTGTAESSDVYIQQTFYKDDLYTKQHGEFNLNPHEEDTVVNTNNVEKDKTYYQNNPFNKKIGSLEFTGNAVETEVVAGKTFYNTDLHEKRTGTLKFDGDAILANVISGAEFYNDSLTSKRTGSMRNNGNVGKKVLNSGGSYTIPSGYHDGNGYIHENTAAEQTAISASAADASKIWNGVSGYVNGTVIKGTGTVSNISNSWISGTSTTSLTITWNKMNSGVFWSGVEISYSDGTLIGYSGNTNTFTVTGLNSSRNYTFRLRSYVIINGQRIFSNYQTTSLSGRTDCAYSCCDSGCDGCGLCVAYCQTC